MKLPVVDDPQTAPWYADGLKFTCSQCGNCCTGGPGYVYLSREEIIRIADHLKLTPETVVEKYCRKVGGEFSLKEKRRGDNYDCIFLNEVKSPATSPAAPGDKVVHSRRICSIYSVRPLQCRTWPFWPENLSSEANWKRAGKRCHGINQGTRVFALPQIQSLKDAKDWPRNPPTSET
jgi:Fe-S-cluster containining protein